jgi:hypothetical protein
MLERLNPTALRPHATRPCHVAPLPRSDGCLSWECSRHGGVDEHRAGSTAGAVDDAALDKPEHEERDVRASAGSRRRSRIREGVLAPGLELRHAGTIIGPMTTGYVPAELTAA